MSPNHVTFRRPLAKRHNRGFSLVELIVVIGVIGLLAGVSIPIMNPIRENAKINKSQRNAQALAATAGAAQAAGADLNLNTVDTAIAQLKVGVPGKGAFGDSVFMVAPFSIEEINELRPYLLVEGNALVYRK
jgi:prepilin-type N-terminal cleavage/methylation domain-containing protein